MVAQYLNYSLNGGSYARLCIMRGIAANLNAPDSLVPPSKQLADWRAVRANTPESYDGLHAGQQSDGSRIWYSHGETGLREQRYCDEVNGARIRHTGWFADVGFMEKVRGVVACLPHGRFVAGYEGSAGDTVIFDKVHHDEVEAAHMADEHARVQAEREKEDSERRQDYTEAKETIAMLEEEVLRRFVTRHHPALAKFYAAEELRRMISDLRKKRFDLIAKFADLINEEAGNA